MASASFFENISYEVALVLYCIIDLKLVIAPSISVINMNRVRNGAASKGVFLKLILQGGYFKSSWKEDIHLIMKSVVICSQG